MHACHAPLPRAQPVPARRPGGRSPHGSRCPVGVAIPARCRSGNTCPARHLFLDRWLPVFLGNQDVLPIARIIRRMLLIAADCARVQSRAGGDVCVTARMARVSVRGDRCQSRGLGEFCHSTQLRQRGSPPTHCPDDPRPRAVGARLLGVGRPCPAHDMDPSVSPSPNP
jgi:hypothetical protein